MRRSIFQETLFLATRRLPKPKHKHQRRVRHAKYVEQERELRETRRGSSISDRSAAAESGSVYVESRGPSHNEAISAMAVAH